MSISSQRSANSSSSDGQLPQRDKSRVARSFSRAAPGYDAAAALQRRVGTRLLSRYVPARRGWQLDLGCGTGHYRDALSANSSTDYLGLDLAEGMLRFAAAGPASAASWLAADAESLPLAANSVAGVFSNLAIQWCEQTGVLFRELYRVLAPGGYCALSSLGPRSLWELRKAFLAVDEHEHVNRFPDPAQLAREARSAGFNEVDLETETVHWQYRELSRLLRELKAIGAHNVNSGAPAGLLGRAALRRLFVAYEEHRAQGLLPATYEVIYMRLGK